MKIARNFGLYYRPFLPEDCNYKLLHILLLDADNFQSQCAKAEKLCVFLNKNVRGHYLVIPSYRFISGNFPSILTADNPHFVDCPQFEIPF